MADTQLGRRIEGLSGELQDPGRIPEIRGARRQAA